MALTLARAIRLLEVRSEEDPDLAEAIRFLAEDEQGPDDPFGRAPAGVVAAARAVNRRRRAENRSEAARTALDTAQVVNLVESISDRKGVDRRRHRGQLLAWRAGARMLHPDWQFDSRRGETRPGLAAVLVALREVTSDAEAADALMRAPREDLDGRSLSDLFATGQVDLVVRMVRSATEQS